MRKALKSYDSRAFLMLNESWITIHHLLKKKHFRFKAGMAIFA